MDAPIASLMAKWFCEGYERQAKKEEAEADYIVKTIDLDALLTLCARYDNKMGESPEHEHDGAAIFAFFKKLKEEAEKVKKKK